MRGAGSTLLFAALALAACGSMVTLSHNGTTGGSSGGGTSAGFEDGGACLTVDMSCGSAQEAGCCAGLICISEDNDAECLVPNGGSCTQDFNCVSESCDAGACRCQTLGNVAFDSAGCCSPLGLTNPAGSGNCCGLAGYTCHNASDCCQGSCQSSQCL